MCTVRCGHESAASAGAIAAKPTSKPAAKTLVRVFVVRMAIPLSGANGLEG
jgi:hypothetical protein